MTSDIVYVKVDDSTMPALRYSAEEAYVPIGYVCFQIDVDINEQSSLLFNSGYRWHREQLDGTPCTCIHVDDIEAWLMTIHPDKSRSEKGQRLLKRYRSILAPAIKSVIRTGVAVIPEAFKNSGQAFLAIADNLVQAQKQAFASQKELEHKVTGIENGQQNIAQKMDAVEDLALRAITRNARPQHRDPLTVLRGRINKFLTDEVWAIYDPEDGEPLGKKFPCIYEEVYRQLQAKTGFNVHDHKRTKGTSWLVVCQQKGYLHHVHEICIRMGMNR